MHPLVRDLYKRVLVVGKDYPTGIDHVKKLWKTALRNPKNCPSWYGEDAALLRRDEEELLRAVHKGRFMVKEMIGVIQLKKYRTMKVRYSDPDSSNQEQMMKAAIEQLEKFKTS